MKRHLLVIALALAALAPSAAWAYDRYGAYSTVCYDRWGYAYACRTIDPYYYRGSYYGPGFGVGLGFWPSSGHHHHTAPHYGSGHDQHGDHVGHGTGHHGFGHGGHHGGHGH